MMADIENCPSEREKRAGKLTMLKYLPGMLLGGLLLASIGCSKNAPPREAPTEGDRLVHLAANLPKNFVHQTFQLRGYKAFEIVVPAHAARPRVHGTFQSFVTGDSGSLVSNESANLDLVLLNEEEFAEFHKGRQGTATFTLDPAYDHMVDFALAATLEEPRTYYLVFRNPAGGPKVKFVKADFTASFD
jgi:hypothetical protein